MGSPANKARCLQNRGKSNRHYQMSTEIGEAQVKALIFAVLKEVLREPSKVFTLRCSELSSMPKSGVNSFDAHENI